MCFNFPLPSYALCLQLPLPSPPVLHCAFHLFRRGIESSSPKLGDPVGRLALLVTDKSPGERYSELYFLHMSDGDDNDITELF